jgi:hypothetical protein
MVRRLLLRLIVAATLAVAATAVGVSAGHATTTTTATESYNYDHLAAFAQRAFGSTVRRTVPSPGLPARSVSIRAVARAGVAAEGAAADAGALASAPNRIYSARVLIRAAEEPGPYHNFPMSFDEGVFGGSRTEIPGYFNQARPGLTNDSIQYRLPGSINGQDGTYEIFTRPSASGRTEVITHRFFNPTGL